MREFLKVMCVVALMVAGVGAAFAWSDRPTTLVWSLRIGLVLICVAALIGFLVIHFRRDLAPDFLQEYFGRYFDRGGFCFSLAMSSENGVCVLSVPFQNRHVNPCYARVAIRPAAGFLGGREFDSFSIDIHADYAAFGVARVAIPMPLAYQGKKQRFELGATVEYPSGKGRTLRFRDGIVVRMDSDFRSVHRTLMTVALFVCGWIVVYYRPASATLTVPADVAENVPNEAEATVETIWRLDDSGHPSASVAEVRQRLRAG